MSLFFLIYMYQDLEKAQIDLKITSKSPGINPVL